MGITNLLPQLSSISHEVNFSELHTIHISEPPSKRRKLNSNDSNSNSDNNNDNNCNHKNHQQQKCRKLRAAIDISAWISSACHGNGAELIDERHLTNYGRTQLLREQEESNKKHDNDNTNANTITNTTCPNHSSHSNAKTGTRSNNNRNTVNNDIQNENNVQVDPQQVEQIQLFINRATKSVLRKIASLQACLSADVLVVFDGATPPIKKICCDQRKKVRNDAASNRDVIIATTTTSATSNNAPMSTSDDVDNNALRSSLSKLSAAKKAGAHTNETYMAVVTSLLKSLREKHIPFMISPYEADGQLAYLSNKGLVDVIISEDSDFIGHGAKAILYKYKEVYTAPYVHYRRIDDNENKDENHHHPQQQQQHPTRKATGVLIRRDDLNASADQSFNLLGFTDVMLALLCVAAGCDYCNSLKGVGIITARNTVKDAFDGAQKQQTSRARVDVNADANENAKSSNKKKPLLEIFFDILFSQSYGKMNLDQKKSYIDNFLSALIMFRHPVVFDPIHAELVFANLEFPDVVLMDYEPYKNIIHSKKKMESIAGKLYCKEMALNVVEGYVNPKSWSLFCGISETPKHICDALRKWNSDTYEIERGGGDSNEDENNYRTTIVLASQSPSGTSSASKLSSQTSGRSSNISVLSPNLLSY